MPLQKRFILNTTENVSKNLSFHSSLFITHPILHTQKFPFNFRLNPRKIFVLIMNFPPKVFLSTILREF